MTAEPLPPPVPEPFRGHTRSPGWTKVAYGIYRPTDSDRLVDELRAWQLALPPEAIFTSLTAARVRGWWTPSPLDPPVFAAVPESSPHPSRPGLFVTRHPRPVTYEFIDGLKVATAPETLLATARDLQLLDLVTLADSALHRRACTATDLERIAARYRWGAPRLRSALPLLDPQSESAWETVLRMLHVSADVEVESQRRIEDAYGRFVARADLWVVGTRRIHEYDGEGHREIDVHRNDLSRDRRLVNDSWQRVGYTKSQLLDEAGTLIAEFDRLLGRPWDRRRLARWNALLDASVHRPSGRELLYRRWSRAL